MSDFLYLAWAYPAGFLFGWTTLAALVLWLYPAGRNAPWIARMHVLFLMRSPEQDNLYRRTVFYMVVLFWALSLIPVVNLAFLAAQVYAVVLELRADAMTQRKLRAATLG